MNTLILQCATSGSVYEAMCDDHQARHEAYADKWGMIFNRIVQDEPDAWVKLIKLKDHMRDGNYERIILLDADAFICDDRVDLREALPSWAWLGLVKHPYPAYGQATHWNVGMSYWRSCNEAIIFINELLTMRAEGATEEQFAINALLWGGRQEGFMDLPRQFNNNWHDMSHDQAVVMGFHGYLPPEQRRVLMRSVAEGYPYADD